ncbi:MAG TPA: DUF6259 domain-containing protein [Bacteroidales bacterium]|nr:DUF6259 domain-containing protein [Bacteroidales bacterium]
MQNINSLKHLFSKHGLIAGHCFKSFRWLLLCFAIAALPSCNNSENGKNITISNDKVMLTFDRSTGSLISFTDLADSCDFLDKIVTPGSLWKVDIAKPSSVRTIDVSSASKFRLSKPDRGTIIMEWMNFREPEDKKLKVTTKVNLETGKSMSSWKISIDGIEGKLIDKVSFPIIKGIKDQGKEELAVPSWMGEIMKNPRSHLSESQGKVKKFEWSYPGPLSLQCIALYNPEKCGFYASCDDSLAYKKSFSFSLDTLNTLVYQMNNYPSYNSVSNSYIPSYSAIIGSFKGDWTVAASIYSEWGTKQDWCRESRLKNKLTPGWLEETALWEWNRGKSDNVLVPAADLRKRLGLPVNVFWHWWHGCSYDDGFPEYIPPREGKKSFVTALSSAQSQGIREVVYMNQLLWGTTTESWKNENAEQASLKNREGKTVSQVFNIFTNKPTAYMCLGTGFWKDKYSSLCDSAINIYKANGVYMDMACLSHMCYDKSHGHPVGGGNWWVENFAQLTKQIRSKIPQEKQSILAGEGSGEAWIPYLDAFLTLQVSMERYAGVGEWEPIPFFQAVYHQYAITYGNYSSLTVPPYDELWPRQYAPKEPLKLLDKGFNRQFLMEQARSFVWGLQPTIANYQSFLAHERKEEIDFLLNLAKTRKQGLKYLLYGKFMKSPDIKSPVKEIDISRLSIYAGKTGNTVTALKGSYNMVYSGTWQSDDKQIGIALANIGDDPYRVDFTMNSNDYELADSGEINIIDADGKRHIASYADRKIHVDFPLEPKGLCIIEVVHGNKQQ